MQRNSFQFWLNDYAAGPLRGRWEDAVADAVAARQCTPIGPRVISTTPNAFIRRMVVRPVYGFRQPGLIGDSRHANAR